jgi:hypothetical protein
MIYEKGDKISQWPETKPGVIIDYSWDPHTDEAMYRIKWSCGSVSDEYENTINHYCNPEEEYKEDRNTTLSQAFSEMYDMICEEAVEFPDAMMNISCKYNLTEEEYRGIVEDYDECQRIELLKFRP